MGERQDTIREKEKVKKRKQKHNEKRYGRSKVIEDFLLQEVYAIIYN